MQPGCRTQEADTDRKANLCFYSKQGNFISLDAGAGLITHKLFSTGREGVCQQFWGRRSHFPSPAGPHHPQPLLQRHLPHGTRNGSCYFSIFSPFICLCISQQHFNLDTCFGDVDGSAHEEGDASMKKKKEKKKWCLPVLMAKRVSGSEQAVHKMLLTGIKRARSQQSPVARTAAQGWGSCACCSGRHRLLGGIFNFILIAVYI